MEFEWDPLKNLANVLKHGISFENAKEAFGDPNQIVRHDTEHSTLTEVRYWLIGRVAKDVLLVVFTYRQKNVRLISARLANEKEREIYGQT